jgi:hypothetical protein
MGTVFATFTATNSVGSSTATFSFQVELPGDWSQDGKLDIADFGAMLNALSDLSAYQQAASLSNVELQMIGDANSDGQVNNADLQALLIRLASASSADGAATAAPAVNSANAVAPPVSGNPLPSVMVAADTNMAPLQSGLLAAPVISSPLPRSVIESTSDVSTADLPAESHPIKVIADSTPAKDARPTLSPSAVDDVLASAWHAASRHGRKLNLTANDHTLLGDTDAAALKPALS